MGKIDIHIAKENLLKTQDFNLLITLQFLSTSLLIYGNIYLCHKIVCHLATDLS